MITSTPVLSYKDVLGFAPIVVEAQDTRQGTDRQIWAVEPTSPSMASHDWGAGKSDPLATQLTSDFPDDELLTADEQVDLAPSAHVAEDEVSRANANRVRLLARRYVAKGNRLSPEESARLEIERAKLQQLVLAITVDEIGALSDLLSEVGQVAVQNAALAAEFGIEL